MKERKRKAVVIVGVVIVISILAVIMVLSITDKMTNISRSISRNDNQKNEKPEALVEPDNWDTSRVTKYVDSEGNIAPIPKGYSASQVTGENLIRTGLVIYEGETPVTGLPGETVGTYSTDENSAWVQSCNRNQWVWVPCPDPSRIYEEDSETGKKKGKLYEYTSTGRSILLSSDEGCEEPSLKGFSWLSDDGNFLSKYEVRNYKTIFGALGGTKERLLNELEIEYEETIKSIKKYGGFYIGRYETGNVDEIGNVEETKPVVQRMNESMRINWCNAYNKMEYLRANKNVRTNMIWGSLWDETLQWLVDSGATDSTGAVIGYAGIADSRSWACFYNARFDYINESGSIEHFKGYGIIPAGSAEYTKANNIYDMAGNLEEWTLEQQQDSFEGGCILRGCERENENYSVSSRVGEFPEMYQCTYDYYGVRMYLYIK